MIWDILISLILGSTFSVLSFPHILHLQICEYLLYRYFSFIGEKGFFKGFVLPSFSFPAKSIRNILMLGIVWVGMVSYFYLLLTIISPIYLQVLLGFVAVFVMKLLPMLGAILTSPLSALYRYRYMYIAQRQLKSSNVKIIAITGSYGKSSVKEYLHRILSARYATGKSRGNRNTEVGLAMEIGLQVGSSMEYFIAEMGAYRKGDIAKLCRRFKPTIGVITGVGNQHLSLFGSRKNILNTKFEMVEGSSERVYISTDWDGASSVISEYKSPKIVAYGVSDGADIRITNVKQSLNGLDFSIKVGNEVESYSTMLLGRHNVTNLVPAILIAREVGMSYADVQQVVKMITPVLGKLSLHEGVNGLRVLNDSYNSNVDGFIAAIDTLDSIATGNKIISTHGVFELGSEKEASYLKILGHLKGKDIELYTTDRAFNVEGYDFVHTFDNETTMFEKIQLNGNGSTLLIEGRHSKSFTDSLGISKVY